jgi:MFS family permease
MSMSLGRDFNRLWLSQGVSNVADGLIRASMPLLAVTMTRSPLLISGMTVASFLPWLLFTLPSGALADRFDRRLIMVAGNASQAAAFGLLVLALIAHLHSIVILYLAVFLSGSADTMDNNAALTVPPRLVERKDLARANGRLFAAQSAINTFVGPPLGAALFAVAAWLAFTSGAALYAIAALALITLPRLMPTESDVNNSRSTPGDIVRRIGAGWSYFWNHRLLRRVAFISASINGFGAATGALIVLRATGPLGVKPEWWGVFIAVPAMGAILGSIIASKMVPKIGGGPVTWLAALVPAASYAVFGFSHSVVLVEIVWFCSSVATALNQIVVSTLRQASVPDELLGRVTAAYRLIVLGVVPLGALLGGALANWQGTATTFIAASIGLTLAALVFASRVTTRALREAEQAGHSGTTDTSLVPDQTDSGTDELDDAPVVTQG